MKAVPSPTVERYMRIGKFVIPPHRPYLHRQMPPLPDQSPSQKIEELTERLETEIAQKRKELMQPRH